jgi:hypothetical protein
MYDIRPVDVGAEMRLQQARLEAEQQRHLPGAAPEASAPHGVDGAGAGLSLVLALFETS